MRFSNDFKKSSRSLIQSAGYTVTYKSVNFGTYDPETQSVSNSETSYILKAAPYRNSFVDVSNPAYVNKIIKTFLISSLDLPIAPKVGDKIVTPDGTLTIFRIQPYEYSGGAAAFRLSCTKD